MILSRRLSFPLGRLKQRNKCQLAGENILQVECGRVRAKRAFSGVFGAPFATWLRTHVNRLAGGVLVSADGLRGLDKPAG